MSSLAAQMLAISVALLQRQEYYTSGIKKPSWNSEYDYIIVGAGTAGSIVASKLSRNVRNSILVVEAGSPANFLADLPNAINENLESTPSWNYVTTPQSHVSNMFVGNSSKIKYPKVIGGSSMVDSMVFDRAYPDDYKRWGYLHGTGIRWTYKRLLPYFRKIETWHNFTQFQDDNNSRGFFGPVPISFPANVGSIHSKFQRAMAMSGFTSIDYNAGDNDIGTGLIQNNIDPQTWRRTAPAHAYLYPAMNHSNLELLSNSHVIRLIVRKNVVCGIEFIYNKQRFVVKARKEVILTAGTIGTAHLLMLSGIGPRKHLEKHNISVVSNLPVGENIQDHCYHDFYYILKNSEDFSLTKYYSDTSMKDLYDFYLNNSGYLTRDPASFLRLSTEPETEDPTADMFVEMKHAKISEDSYKNTKQPTKWKQYFNNLIHRNDIIKFRFSVLNPSSRGTIKLSSSNPFHAPIIDPKYFNDTRDFTTHMDGLVYVLKLFENKSFNGLFRPYQQPIPGCKNFYCPKKSIYSCQKYLECYVRQMTVSASHFVGSAPMGRNENVAVVDSALRVIGVKNLRVMDSSVIPQIISGQPNAITMVIAEMGSDFILSNS